MSAVNACRASSVALSRPSVALSLSRWRTSSCDARQGGHIDAARPTEWHYTCLLYVGQHEPDRFAGGETLLIDRVSFYTIPFRAPWAGVANCPWRLPEPTHMAVCPLS